MKKFFKKSCICLLLMMFLSGCTTTPKNNMSDYKGEITLYDISSFYRNNSDVLNKAAKEYILQNSNNDYISIFYNEYNQIKIWDSTNQVDLTTKGNYKFCLELIDLMNKYMFDCGFEKPNVDYSVSISQNEFRSEYTNKNEICYAVLFEFAAYDINVEEEFDFLSFSLSTIDNTIYYRLYYSENELNDIKKIADNWYIEVMNHI